MKRFQAQCLAHGKLSMNNNWHYYNYHPSVLLEFSAQEEVEKTKDTFTWRSLRFPKIVGKETSHKSRAIIIQVCCSCLWQGFPCCWVFVPFVLGQELLKSLLTNEVMARMGRGLQKFLASPKEPPLYTPVFFFLYNFRLT